MGTISRKCIIAVVAAFSAIACTNKDMPDLKVEGTALKAGDEVVRLKGMSFGWHNLWPRFYNEGAVKTLHNEWGCRLFRAAIGADSHALGDNPWADHGYIGDKELALDCLYKVIDGAVEDGCYVIVDWHSHVLHTEEAKEFFGTVAERYAGVPNVIYELFNEPVSTAFESERSYADTSEEEYELFWKQLKDYAEEVISVIKEAEKGYEPLILMGCPKWDQRIDLPAKDPITCYGNIMYTVHFYAASHKDELISLCDKALRDGCPIFISECASCWNTGDGYMDEESWAKWDSWAASNNVSTVAWSISDKKETCSMFTKEASSEGPWAENVIKPWGSAVRKWLAK